MEKRATKFDEIKGQIRDRIANRRPLTQQIKEERERKNDRSAASYWERELKKNWFTYFLLSCSALFTGLLGLFMGLAPHLTPSETIPGQMDITFNTDLGHVVIAILLIIGFISITEGAFAVGKWKFHTREDKNRKQYGSMMAVMVLAIISTVGTGWAGFQVVASTLGYFSEFREIPPWAQDWAVRIIPVLFGFYMVLFSIYWLSSESAQMDRIAHQEREAQKADHQFTMEMLELDLEEEVLVAEAEALVELVRRGKISKGQLDAARRAKMGVLELEEHLGKDLNDDGQIGLGRPPSPVSGPKHQPNPNKHSTNGQSQKPLREYDLGGLLKALGMKQDEFRAFLIETDTVSKAWQVLRDDKRLPLDISHKNFNRLAMQVNPTVGTGSHN